MKLLLPALLSLSWFTLAHSYVFDVSSAICTQVLWSVTLTPVEWVMCNKIEFYVRDPLRINPPQILNLTCAVGSDIGASGYTSFRTPVTESPNQRSWEIGAAVIGYDGDVLSDSSSNFLNFYETWQVGNCPTPTAYSNPVVSTPISTPDSTRPYTTPTVPPTWPVPKPSPCADCEKAINIAAIVGGAIGGVVALTMIALFIWLLCRRKRARKAEAAQNAQFNRYSVGGASSMSPDEKAFSLNDARPLSGIPSLPMSGSGTPSQGTYGSPYMAPVSGVAATAAATPLSPATIQEDPTMSPSNTQASYPTYTSHGSAPQGLASPPLSPLILANTSTGMAAGSSVGGFASAKPTTAGSVASSSAGYFDAPATGAANARPNPLLGAMPAWTPSSNMPTPEPMTSGQPAAGSAAGQSTTGNNEALLNEPMSSAQQY